MEPIPHADAVENLDDAPLRPPTSCRHAAAVVVGTFLEVPPLRLRLATVPHTQTWRTPSLVVLGAGGPVPFVVGLTRCLVDVYEGPCDESAGVDLVDRLRLRPSAAMSALWYAVFFAIPFLGSILADLVAVRWIRRVGRAVVAELHARHGDSLLRDDGDRPARLAEYLAERRALARTT